MKQPIEASTSQPAAGAPTRPEDVEAAGPPTEIAALAQQARDHYERALKAQREGNWALYGEEIRKLGDVLERMRNRR